MTDTSAPPPMSQQEIETLAEALRSQGLTWAQTNFSVSLVRNACTARDAAWAETSQTASVMGLTAADGAPTLPDKTTPAMRDALRLGHRGDCPSDELCEVRYAALRAAVGATKGDA